MIDVFATSRTWLTRYANPMVYDEEGKFIVFKIATRNHNWIKPGYLISVGFNTHLGNDTVIGDMLQIYENVKVGSNCIIDNNVKLHPNSKVGDNVKIGNNVTCGRGAVIANGCVLNEKVHIPNNAVLAENTLDITHIGAAGSDYTPSTGYICGVNVGHIDGVAYLIAGNVFLPLAIAADYFLSREDLVKTKVLVVDARDFAKKKGWKLIPD